MTHAGWRQPTPGGVGKVGKIKYKTMNNCKKGGGEWGEMAAAHTCGKWMSGNGWEIGLDSRWEIEKVKERWRGRGAEWDEEGWRIKTAGWGGWGWMSESGQQ